jgi:hypothetical protein
MKRLTNCKPLQIWNEMITDDWTFLNKEVVKQSCSCINKQTCLAILELLSNKKYEEADVLFFTLYNNENKMW